MSKPSGPTQRAPLINQQPSPRSSSMQGQFIDIQKDDAASLYKYLSAVASSQNVSVVLIYLKLMIDCLNSQ